MDPELEALLKCFDAFLEARGGSEERRLFELYDSLLSTTSDNRRINRDTLDWAVRRRYPTWAKVNTRPGTLPPSA